MAADLRADSGLSEAKNLLLFEDLEATVCNILNRMEEASQEARPVVFEDVSSMSSFKPHINNNVVA